MSGLTQAEQDIKRRRVSGDPVATAAASDGDDPPARSAGAPQPGARAAAGSQGAASGGGLVLVWDLDETLLIFNSLLTGTFAVAQRRPDAEEALLALGRRWEAAILRLCDERFFFEKLEEYDQTCLAGIQPYDDGASLAGYDFGADGFPPPGQGQQQQKSPEQHASAARPAPCAAPAPGGAGQKQQDQQQAQQQQPLPPPSPAGSPASSAVPRGEGGCDSQQPPGRALPGAPAACQLDAASLTKLAYRYRRIAKLCTFGLQALGTAAQRQEWQALFAETDTLTDGWLSHAAALLEACSSQLGGSSSTSGGSSGRDSSSGGGEVIHVAVTSGQLIPSLAKLLLYRLGRYIPPDQVWSSRWMGKQRCFEAVRQRYGDSCSYLVIGDGIEEDEAAAALGWPYVRVLLAPAEHYPAERVLSWRPDAATRGPGLPFTQLTAAHLAQALGVQREVPAAVETAAHGGSAAVAALEAHHGAAGQGGTAGAAAEPVAAEGDP